MPARNKTNDWSIDFWTYPLRNFIRGCLWHCIFIDKPNCKTDKLKITRQLISVIGGLWIASFYLFVSPTKNHELATIESRGEKFLVTLAGERLLMAHDPISFLKRGTYTETFQLVIPRNNGEIKGSEITTEKGHYKMDGTVVIDGENMKIDLYYDNDDDRSKTH